MRRPPKTGQYRIVALPPGAYSVNLAYSSTFSASWPAPTQVLTARLFRLSAQMEF